MQGLDHIDVARELVAYVAPEEVDFFDELKDAEGQKKDEKDVFLGFGGDDAGTVIVTTILIAVAKDVVQFIWANGKDATGRFVREASDEVRKSLMKKLKDWLSGRAGTKAPVVVERQQLEQKIKKIASTGVAAKLSPSQQARVVHWVEAKFGDGA